MARPKTQFCPKGHNKDVVGRDKHGHCLQCRKENRKPVKTHRKKVCPKGHIISIFGRDKSGSCKGCKRKHKKLWDEQNKEHVQEYRKEHGKKWRDEHKEEIKYANKKYVSENKEKISKRRHEYYEENKDKIVVRIKEWRKKNIKLVRMYSRKCLEKRKNRVVAWTDWENIFEFEFYKPEGMTTDHYIPLNGKLVWGLHVSWNLRYLSPHDNFSKQNKIDLLEASEWYGKILEEAGLK